MIKKFQFVIDDEDGLQRFEEVKNHYRIYDDKEIITIALKKLWEETRVPDKVVPLRQYKKRIENLTGKSGPYIVEELRRSSLGLSKGLYKLEGCEALLPVDWFNLESKIPTAQFRKAILASILLIPLMLSGYLIKRSIQPANVEPPITAVSKP